MYAELATWWPLVSPAGRVCRGIRVLRARAGGLSGTEIAVTCWSWAAAAAQCVHLKGRFDMALVDRSPACSTSARLNPRASIHQGDMRTVALAAASTGLRP